MARNFSANVARTASGIGAFHQENVAGSPIGADVLPTQPNPRRRRDLVSCPISRAGES